MAKTSSFILLIIGLLLTSMGFAQDSITSGRPLTLGSAIQIALDNNPAIKASSEKIKGSKARFWSEISPAPAEFSMTNDYVPVGTALNNYGEKTVGISQSIDFPTNYLFRGSKSSIERKIIEKEFMLTKLGVVSKVKKAYYQVVALQEQVGIAGGNRAIALDFAKKADVRYSVGEGTNLEKLTAKVNQTEALNNVEIQKNHLTIAMADLSLSMGYGKGGSGSYSLSDTLACVPLPFTLDQLVDEAMSVNPLLEANKLRVDAYSADRSLAWSGILPGFNLGCFAKEVRGDATKYYGASLSIGIPLWFMLDQRGKIMEASANLSTATADLRTANNEVYAKTQDAFAEFKHAEKQVQLYVNDILPQAEEVFRTASKSYEAGEITYIEFLQAQQTLINSRGSYVDALLSYNLSLVTIEEAIGKTLQ